MAPSRSNVRKRESTWTYYAYVTDGSGKRRQVSKGGFATRREAEAARVESLAAMASGSWVRPERLSVRDFWPPAGRSPPAARSPVPSTHFRRSETMDITNIEVLNDYVVRLRFADGAHGLKREITPTAETRVFWPTPRARSRPKEAIAAPNELAGVDDHSLAAVESLEYLIVGTEEVMDTGGDQEEGSEQLVPPARFRDESGNRNGSAVIGLPVIPMQDMPPILGNVEHGGDQLIKGHRLRKSEVRVQTKDNLAVRHTKLDVQAFLTVPLWSNPAELVSAPGELLLPREQPRSKQPREPSPLGLPAPVVGRAPERFPVLDRVER